MPDSAAWRDFLDRLSQADRGGLSVREHEPLAGHTTLRIGGAARVLLRCGRAETVAAAVRAAAAARVPWKPLGLGGNVLVPDAGLDVAVLVLTGALATVEVAGNRVRGGGGAPLARVVRAAVRARLAGIECLGGIPSTLGGALAGNAGAFGQEIMDVVENVNVVDGDGVLRTVPRGAIPGGYRWSVLGEGRIVTSADLALAEEDPAVLAARVAQVRERRLAAMPPEPSAGSVFRNPPGDHAGRLLDLAGCKGLRHGGAEVSPRHANVIVNAGGASAADVRALVALMAAKVRQGFGIRLELELKILDREGRPLADPEAALAWGEAVW